MGLKPGHHCEEVTSRGDFCTQGFPMKGAISPFGRLTQHIIAKAPQSILELSLCNHGTAQRFDAGMRFNLWPTYFALEIISNLRQGIRINRVNDSIRFRYTPSMTTLLARSLACALQAFALLFHPAIGQEVGSMNDKLSLTQRSGEGDADAQFELGCRYSQLQDHEEAIKWFRKSAGQGHALAQYNMGFMSANGMGVSQNHKEAAKWYLKAAEQGYAEAQCNLGAMHYNGHGVIKDHKEAVKWFHKAAEQGNATAQNSLGLMYYQGQGVPQDYNEAVTWYRMAAEQGNAKAQHNMGLMYYQGQGVIKDYVQTHAWYNVASANGEDEHASKDRDLVAKQMTQEQIAKAQKLAKEWFKKFRPKK